MEFGEWAREDPVEAYLPDEFAYWEEVYTLAIALRLSPDHIESMSEVQQAAAVAAFNKINKDRN